MNMFVNMVMLYNIKHSEIQTLYRIESLGDVKDERTWDKGETAKT